MKRYLLYVFSIMLFFALSVPHDSIAQAPPLSKKEMRQQHKKYKKHHAHHHRVHKKAFKKHKRHHRHLAMHHESRYRCDCYHHRKMHRKHKRHHRHTSFSLAPVTATVLYSNS